MLPVVLSGQWIPIPFPMPLTGISMLDSPPSREGAGRRLGGSQGFVAEDGRRRDLARFNAPDRANHVPQNQLVISPET